ncbi:MAG TPA: hypothetical protein VE825_07010 [Terriglobales bacterium]|jgi:hypothetical protein|nr:hypothetical protein [Terriglobales bacterium]
MTVTDSSSDQSLGALLGLRGASIAWGRVLCFTLAWMFCAVPSVLFFTLRQGNFPPASYWVFELFGSLLFAALVVVSFRSIRDDVGAALLAAIAYTLLIPGVRVLSNPAAMLSRAFLLVTTAAPLFGPLLVLLGLALSLRSLRPRWLAVWVGSLGGFVGSYLVSAGLSFFYLARAGATAARLPLNPEGLVSALVTATAFTLIFEVFANLLD